MLGVELGAALFAGINNLRSCAFWCSFPARAGYVRERRVCGRGGDFRQSVVQVKGGRGGFPGGARGHVYHAVIVGVVRFGDADGFVICDWMR